jgi:hypothetical protein
MKKYSKSQVILKKKVRKRRKWWKRGNNFYIISFNRYLFITLQDLITKDYYI